MDMRVDFLSVVSVLKPSPTELAAGVSRSLMALEDAERIGAKTGGRLSVGIFEANGFDILELDVRPGGSILGLSLSLYA